MNGLEMKELPVTSKEVNSMEEKQSVWKQIEEDEEDYQYFKDHDEEVLKQTIEAIKKEHIANIQQV